MASVQSAQMHTLSEFREDWKQSCSISETYKLSACETRVCYCIPVQALFDFAVKQQRNDIAFASVIDAEWVKKVLSLAIGKKGINLINTTKYCKGDLIWYNTETKEFEVYYDENKCKIAIIVGALVKNIQLNMLKLSNPKMTIRDIKQFTPIELYDGILENHCVERRIRG